MEVNPLSVSSRISSAWRSFISNGQPNTDMISAEVMDSWRRCYMTGVNPDDGTCYNVLPQIKLNKLLDKNKDLIDIARPFMLKLYEFVKGSGFMVAITDKQGYILELFGDEVSLQRTKPF